MSATGPELYGQEGVDDDGNGYVDDIYGWNFIYSSAYPYGSNKITPVEHGTHVAGTIGAENNNGKGSAAWPEAAEAIGRAPHQLPDVHREQRATTATK